MLARKLELSPSAIQNDGADSSRSIVRLTARATAKPARTSDMAKKQRRFYLFSAAAPAHVARMRRHSGNSDPPPRAGHVGARSRACSPHTQGGARSISGDGQQELEHVGASYIHVRVLNSARWNLLTCSR